MTSKVTYSKHARPEASFTRVRSDQGYTDFVYTPPPLRSLWADFWLGFKAFTVFALFLTAVILLAQALS